MKKCPLIDEVNLRQFSLTKNLYQIRVGIHLQVKKLKDRTRRISKPWFLNSGWRTKPSQIEYKPWKVKLTLPTINFPVRNHKVLPCPRLKMLSDTSESKSRWVKLIVPKYLWVKTIQSLRARRNRPANRTLKRSLTSDLDSLLG